MQILNNWTKAANMYRPQSKLLNYGLNCWPTVYVTVFACVGQEEEKGKKKDAKKKDKKEKKKDEKKSKKGKGKKDVRYYIYCLCLLF